MKTEIAPETKSETEPQPSMEDIDQLYSKCRLLSARVGAFLKRTVAETDSLGSNVGSLLQSAESITRDVQSIEDEKLRAAMMERMKAVKGILDGNGPGGDLKKLCNKKIPFMLRLMLGNKVSVMAYRREQGLALKEEYHSFRDWFAAGVLLLPTLLLLLMKWGDSKRIAGESYRMAPAVMAGQQMYLAWLCYMYLALALRENVLVVNGSNIKSWWIIHHYLSIVACLIMLALPDNSPAVNVFSTKFLFWTQFQGIVMMIQNWYQRRRMYTQIAMGKNTIMDVVTGESSGSRGQLLLLYPMLFALQFWQVYISGQVIWMTIGAMVHPGGWLDEDLGELDLHGQRGIFGAGIVFGLMGILNFLQTITTMRAKLPSEWWKNPGEVKFL